MKLHIEFDIDLNDQWSKVFKIPHSEKAYRGWHRMKYVLDNKFTFGKISELTISPKTSEV